MKRYSLVNEAHKWVKQRLVSGDIALDATVGNGRDTVFLAEQVGLDGKVFGFDIQESALETACNKLKQANLLTCTTLIHASHADMSERIPVQYHGMIKAIMFNLGYLPGGHKSIITLAHSTIVALNAACRLLAADGILTVLAYPGHEGGELETEHVKQWHAQLNGKQFIGHKLTPGVLNPSAPILFVISKAY